MISKRPAILFISMPGAIHTGRWMDQLLGEDWDLHLFSPTAASDLTIHETIASSTTLHLVVKQNRSNVRQTGLFLPFRKGDRVRMALTKAFERFKPRGERLAHLIEKIKPDLLHSMEISKAGYLTLEAKRIIEDRGGRFPKWIYSCWGNDLYMYGQIAEHSSRIRDVLENVDYMFTDCERDNGLAREYGFTGKILGVYPTGGGFPVRVMQGAIRKRVSVRKTIALKGIIRSDNQGRALVALEALENCADILSGYRIAIYSADPPVQERANQMKDQLYIELLPAMSHPDFLKLFGETKISIGLNISDGTPNTMLESMIMGAFPIQSDTVSTREWIEHGVNGLLVDPDNPADLAQAIRSVIDDEAALERAASYNQAMTRERLEREKVTSEVVKIYRALLAE